MAGIGANLSNFALSLAQFWPLKVGQQTVVKGEKGMFLLIFHVLITSLLVQFLHL
jgi:hypothetical protein